MAKQSKPKQERKPKNTFSVSEREAICSLRERGFAVIVWTPKELRNAEPDRVEERSIELGWDVIGALN